VLSSYLDVVVGRKLLDFSGKYAYTCEFARGWVAAQAVLFVNLGLFLRA
jgi:hypothetical protein